MRLTVWERVVAWDAGLNKQRGGGGVSNRIQGLRWEHKREITIGPCIPIQSLPIYENKKGYVKWEQLSSFLSTDARPNTLKTVTIYKCNFYWQMCPVLLLQEHLPALKMLVILIEKEWKML